VGEQAAGWQRGQGRAWGGHFTLSLREGESVKGAGGRAGEGSMSASKGESV